MAESNKEKNEKVKVLRIKAGADNFRRAGLEFGRDEKVVRVDELNAAQVKAIKGERMLTVVEDTIDMPVKE